MAWDVLQNEAAKTGCAAKGGDESRMTGTIMRLQFVTVAWMSVEFGVSLFAAIKARSPALFAFGSDSGVELLSALVVLLAVFPSFHVSEERASRWAGVLLFALATVVALTAGYSLLRHIEPQASLVGIVITAAALVVMPILAWLKRRAARVTRNRALAADAVQSATCAYLAALALLGLLANALFHIHSIDSVAAIAIVPLLIIEGKRALEGESCTAC